MNALLVRVGADQSAEGGRWNGPVDSSSGEFVYVAIPESARIHPGLERPYALLAPSLTRLGQRLPPGLIDRHMHLDPDFECLSYGDRGQRGRQLSLQSGDWVVFYAAFADIRGARGACRLVYALIGWLVVDRTALARDLPVGERDRNAHTRRLLAPDADDIVVLGRPGESGRLRRCIPIGGWRDGAYRVHEDLLESWGGISVRNGWLQRSGRLPRFLDPERFRRWLQARGPDLIPRNNE
jgi:hypothetical protein